MTNRFSPIAACAVALGLALPGYAAGDASVAGKASFESKCALCHNAEANAGNSVGPNLHGVVGRAVGSAPGFSYSSAITKLGGYWTSDRIVAFLQNPQAFAPGTVMPFSGIKSEADRQAIVCFIGGDRAQPVCK